MNDKGVEFDKTNICAKCVWERERERERERDSEQWRENEISHLTGGDILLDNIERPNFNRQSLKGF